MAWLTNWNRRKPIRINGTIAGPQTNYQMKLIVHKGSGFDGSPTPLDIYLGLNVRDDFGDVRFTSSDETTLLNYWIENVTPGSSAIIWVNVDSILASPFYKSIYIYYGNLYQTTTSNGSATFDFFDDFSTGSIDSNKWTIIQGSWTITANKTLRETGADWRGATILSSIIPTGGRHWKISTSRTCTTDYSCANWIITYFQNAVGTIRYNLEQSMTSGRYNWYGGYRFYGPGGQLGPTVYVSWGSGWHTFDIYLDQNGHWRIYLDNVLGIDITDNTYADMDNIRLWASEGTAEWDDIHIRKYISPEPTIGAISPEQTYTADLSISSIPAGAEIYINGTDTALQTDLTFVLNPGTYNIALYKPGYEPWATIITLISNQSAIVQGNLVLATGYLDISSTPSGARIMLAPTGQTLVDQGIDTNSIISLSVGTYDYKLTKTDYYDSTGTFNILSGQTTIVSVVMIPLPCPITIKNSGDILILKATPIQGVAPYTVEFRRANSQSMTNIVDTANVDGETYIIPTVRLGGSSNPVLDASEGTQISRIYTLNITDLNDATSKTPGEGSSLLFATKMIDSCSPYQLCVKYCKIFVACAVPVCDFTVT